MIQLRFSGTTTVHHSVMIYDDNATCDGKHKGGAEKCLYSGRKEMLYAQHSDDFDNGHLRALLKGNEDNILIIKFKKDV